jgi:hypothetical protein
MFRSREDLERIQDINLRNWERAKSTWRVIGAVFLIVLGAATIWLWWIYLTLPF